MKYSLPTRRRNLQRALSKREFTPKYAAWSAYKLRYSLSEQILDGNFRSRPEAVETYGESGANGNLRRNMPLRSVVAAAAEYNHDRKDHDPGAVIVKKMAQAVVIHICFPPKMLQGSFLLSTIL